MNEATLNGVCVRVSIRRRNGSVFCNGFSISLARKSIVSKPSQINETIVISGIRLACGNDYGGSVFAGVNLSENSSLIISAFWRMTVVKLL